MSEELKARTKKFALDVVEQGHPQAAPGGRWLICWGAHALRVLVMAPRHHELLFRSWPAD